VAEHRGFTSRTKARKRAADVVFEADQRGMGRNPRVLEDLLRERRVLTAAQTPLPEYSITLIEGVAANLRRIDGLIEAHAEVPGLDRIPPVDLAVMRVAVWEMLDEASDVADVTAIDQAVMIVKSISTDTSPGFVNAVLDAVRREIGAPAWSRRPVAEGESAPSEDTDEDGPAGEPVASEPVAADAEDRAPEDVAEAPEPATGAPSSGALEPGDRHPTLEELGEMDLASLDELLDEY
jgi:N utilization substance protein B